ncbi:UDP-glucose/GDP-mannose dehydrogenase [gamma proteobacterium HTCC5015]|nr:UDP-glucose/GDP-mannose dehydrogenase [gamma proteobacterium HTCC5015]
MTQTLSDTKIAIIGLGYVGLPLAAEFGKQYDVVGFDINQVRIDELLSGHDTTLELTDAELAEAKGLNFTTELESIRQCNVYIVTVPTPVDGANRPDFTPLKKASQAIGGVLENGDTVIYESTVFPGCTEEICVPELEKSSGLVFNRDFYCGYSPERINPGDKVNRLPTIVKITSGSTPQVADYVDSLYASIVTAGTHRAPSMKVAEAAKVIENTQRDINIGLMNELSVLFDRIGIDTNAVIDAAATKWNFLRFNPGLVGGHCIGVDPYYLTYKAEQVGYLPQMILAGRRLNDNMGRYVARNTIRKMLQLGMDVPRCRIGLLGVTFKENCPDIRNSKVIDVVRELEAWGANVAAADTWANPEEVQKEYGFELQNISAEEPVDALIVAVGHHEYRDLTAEELCAMVNNEMPLIVDVKGLYSQTELEDKGCTVFRL